MTDIPHFARPYSLVYFKHGHYWRIDATDAQGKALASLAHIDGENRPYGVTHNHTEFLYPTYSEACAVFLNILRQG